MVNSLVEALKNGATLDVVNQEVQKAPGNAGAEAAEEAKDPVTKAVAFSGIPSDFGKENECKETEEAALSISGGEDVSFASHIAPESNSPEIMGNAPSSSRASIPPNYYTPRPTKPKK